MPSDGGLRAVLISTPTLLLLAILAVPDTATPPRLQDCEATPSRIELMGTPDEPTREICISPTLPTTLQFDSALGPGPLQLQERERFGDLLMGVQGFTIIPPADLQPGERLKLVVHFADGATPESATFTLIGHPVLGARKIDVFRRRRTLEDYQRVVKEKEATIHHLQTKLDRVQTQGSEPGIAGLIASGLMQLGGQGVMAKELTKYVLPSAVNSLQLKKVYGYRSTTAQQEEAMVRVAVALTLKNPDTQPWMIQGAALRAKGQDAKRMKHVWQAAPLLPGEETKGLVVVETDMTEREARDTFTLELWDERGGRRFVLSNVTFP